MDMDYVSQIAFALLLAVPVACVAWTITQEELFQELRDVLKAYQRQHPGSFWRQKLAYLPTCPYCLSHYIAAVAVALFRFKMLADDWRGYVASILTLVLLANVYITLYHLLRVALRTAKAVADRAEATAEVRRQSASAALSTAKEWPARTVARGSLSRQTRTPAWDPPAERQELAAIAQSDDRGNGSTGNRHGRL